MTAAEVDVAAAQRAKNLGLALVTMGLFELAWVAFCVFGGSLLALLGFADDSFGPIGWVGGAAYAMLAAVNLPIGVLQLVAGMRLRRGRGLISAVAALAATFASLILALYCSPLGLAVMVYGAIVLADADVRAYLERES